MNGRSVAVELRPGQILAAQRLYREHMPRWQLADDALSQLRAAVPGFDPQPCVLKCIAVNSLYATRVFAIVDMAAHVHTVIDSMGEQLPVAGSELVMKIATPPQLVRHRRFISFAAKFCHFFVDASRFAIYDEAAKEALKLHLSRIVPTTTAGANAYESFRCDAEDLRRQVRWNGSLAELDRYLWITGTCQQASKSNAALNSINKEVREIIKSPGSAGHRELAAVLPQKVFDSLTILVKRS